MTANRLSDLSRCFQGVIPSMVATADGDGVPNITYVSQVFLVDDRHVALSCQFFNKTRRNLDQNPLACVEVYDPLTFQAYRLHLRYLRSEKTGSLFDCMALRIEAIASLTGMSGIFKLIAADIFEVEHLEQVDGFLTEQPPLEAVAPLTAEGIRSELKGLQLISDRINRAPCLEFLIETVLEALDQYFGFSHTMVLLPDESTGNLVAVASRGYGQSGVGAEVRIGEGLIGMVARERRVLRITNLDAGLRYARAVRRAVIRDAGDTRPEIPLPGLPDAESAVIMPLSVGDRLVGVLAAESPDQMRFGDWHEAYLEVIGNQIALGIDRMQEEEEDAVAPVPSRAEAGAVDAAGNAVRRRTLTYYRNDDCVFVDDEYLIRNVPGRILWKLMREWQRQGRTEFSNRELRLDPSLGLPPVKDNLESRLILLRGRLKEKCPDIRIVPTARGRFSLDVGAAVELVER
jgi:hypothetical protein